MKILIPIGILFVCLNIIFSQNISPLYGNLLKEDQPSIITFLKSVKSSPKYAEIVDLYLNEYGDYTRKMVYEEDELRAQRIVELDELLTINPNARDVLYAASILYADDGNRIKASEYLKRARHLDPSF